MSNYILLIFEGQKTEKQIFESLNQYFLNEKENTILLSAYCSHIYSLYHTIENDSDLDLFVLLKQRTANQKILSDISRDEVAEIYLFFDYDGHDPTATDEKLTEMLTHFNEETENGKLYISYPMVESLKHLRQDSPFENTVVDIHNQSSYKQFASENCDQDYVSFKNIEPSCWKIMLSEHCKKLNHLMTEQFELPSELTSQIDEFNMQKQKHITPNNQVAVISAFPIFIADYYGYSELKRRLEAE